ncbi:hypothetical protein [Sphingobacterium sp. DR205]|uniref:hypothetical protein n=1 Tax=Sphingobacterium sp. DR205 TaxID=2713573 RepID=UPI0013E4B508|nr:hypothetical protein [Sphingobacterium sp. DR205]QIH32064.1 hypothetical protein G6053_03720 [Sphingobacterium sp. DR205]
MEDMQSVPLVVPRNFKLICELFGIAVPAFIQLFLDHYSFMDQNFVDNSSYNLATRGIHFIDDKFKLGTDPLSIKLDQREKERGVKLIQRQVKLGLNRNYSTTERRNRGRVITGQIYDILSKGRKMKDIIYLDENTCFKLNKDLLLTCILNNTHPSHYINGMMQLVSIPDYLAELHLDEGEYNPILGFIIRVHDGYGNINNLEYRNSARFKNFIMEIQELNKRYFFYRGLEKRVAVYQEWLDDFLENRAEDNIL